jgi:molecular chaperone GrpE
MEEVEKSELLERFRQYLDGLDDEQSPDEAELAEEEDREPDLYTLFTELAGLRNEVKLESRQVKQALDHSRELIDALQENNRRMNRELAELRRAEDALRADAERDLLLEVLELRDRQAASLDSLIGFAPGGLFERPHGRTRQLLESMQQGLEIGLRRLDGLLERYSVRPMPAVGERLDPNRMQAAATAYDPDQEEGVILQEIRKGYLRGDKVLRLAEVVVNKQETN